jgi:hypothetical protein
MYQGLSRQLGFSAQRNAAEWHLVKKGSKQTSTRNQVYDARTTSAGRTPSNRTSSHRM